MRNVLPKRAVLVPAQATRVFKGIIYDTYQWQQELYNGTVKTFEMLKRPDTVKVIAVDDQKIIILEQEQPNLNKFYDIPGGIHDHSDEDELTAAKRELLEETGMQFREWRLLSVAQPQNKIEQFVYIFLATNKINQIAQKLDSGERISVKVLTFDEAKRLLNSFEGRFLPKEIDKTDSIDELLSLPTYL